MTGQDALPHCTCNRTGHDTLPHCTCNTTGQDALLHCTCNTSGQDALPHCTCIMSEISNCTKIYHHCRICIAHSSWVLHMSLLVSCPAHSTFLTTITFLYLYVPFLTSMLQGYIVTKVCASPKNWTWFTTLFLLVRGWGLGTRLMSLPG